MTQHVQATAVPSPVRTILLADLIALASAGAVAVVIKFVFHSDAPTAIAIGFGVLGLSGLFFGNVQYRDARDTLNKLTDATNELEDIRSSADTTVGTLEGLSERATTTLDQLTDLKKQLSTERLQAFPYFIPEIVGVLEGANSKLEIFCDYPTYGIWSSPADYERYANALAVTKARIQLLCVNEQRREQLIEEEVKDTGGFEAWRASDEMRAFLHAHAAEREAASLTMPDFVDILKRKDRDALDHLFSAGDGTREVWETDLVMPLFFWIADGTEAVFALAPHTRDTAASPSTPPRAGELGFRTRDPELIAALRRIFDSYKRVLKRTEKLDANAEGLLSFGGGRPQWLALLECWPRECGPEASELRRDIEKWTRTWRP